jgi:hypothetical protein
MKTKTPQSGVWILAAAGTHPAEPAARLVGKTQSWEIKATGARESNCTFPPLTTAVLPE